MEELKDYIPGEYEVKEISIRFKDGRKDSYKASTVTGAVASSIRNGEAESITVTLK